MQTKFEIFENAQFLGDLNIYMISRFLPGILLPIPIPLTKIWCKLIRYSPQKWEYKFKTLLTRQKAETFHCWLFSSLMDYLVFMSKFGGFLHILTWLLGNSKNKCIKWKTQLFSLLCCRFELTLYQHAKFNINISEILPIKKIYQLDRLGLGQLGLDLPVLFTIF